MPIYTVKNRQIFQCHKKTNLLLLFLINSSVEIAPLSLSSWNHQLGEGPFKSTAAFHPPSSPWQLHNSSNSLRVVWRKGKREHNNNSTRTNIIDQEQVHERTQQSELSSAELFQRTNRQASKYSRNNKRTPHKNNIFFYNPPPWNKFLRKSSRGEGGQRSSYSTTPTDHQTSHRWSW